MISILERITSCRRKEITKKDPHALSIKGEKGVEGGTYKVSEREEKAEEGTEKQFNG